MLNPDRYFDAEPTVRGIARHLYQMVSGLPLVCPHGHVDPGVLAANTPFQDAVNLFLLGDHYIFRMLYSQGIPLESLGIPRRDGQPVETDRRKIWQRFCDNYFLFLGTPTSCWLRDELATVFGIHSPIGPKTAMAIYDEIEARLAQPDFRPRQLFERFNIEVLCTTDAATDSLQSHQQMRESGWKGDVRPTFRPDAVIDPLNPSWKTELTRLAELVGRDLSDFRFYLRALEDRRIFFKQMGATATDHAALTAYTEWLTYAEADRIYQRALGGRLESDDQTRFVGHMLCEMARMSIDDGLVMQLHVGSFRNHNPAIFEHFGADKGCDIPVASEFTRNLRPLLARFGNDPRLTLILFTLDESTYSRELAPLAGHYPALRLGPAWWFHDSLEGMKRFRERTTETAGIYNTVGFNDDTRAFLSIPARHDLSRRVDANFLANLVSRHVIEVEEAEGMIVDLAYNLVRKAYRLDGVSPSGKD